MMLPGLPLHAQQGAQMDVQTTLKFVAASAKAASLPGVGLPPCLTLSAPRACSSLSMTQVGYSAVCIRCALLPLPRGKTVTVSCDLRLSRIDRKRAFERA